MAAYGLDGAAVGGELAEPVEDPPPAHAGNCDEVADGNAFGWYGGQRASEDRVWVLLPVAGVRLVCAGIVGYGGRLPGPVYRGVAALAAALRRARGVRWRRAGAGLLPDDLRRVDSYGDSNSSDQRQAAATGGSA